MSDAHRISRHSPPFRYAVGVIARFPGVGPYARTIDPNPASQVTSVTDASDESPVRRILSLSVVAYCSGVTPMVCLNNL